MDATTSKYLSDHYMAAALWARAIEGSKKVKSIETYERYAVVRIDGERVLRMDELMKLAKLCKASGLEYVICHGTTDLMIVIDKA